MTTPSFRQIFIAWLMLLALTLGTIFSGQVGGGNPIGTTWLAFLLVVTGLKAFTILHWFLNLRAASSFWTRLFIYYLILLLLIIFGSYAFI